MPGYIVVQLLGATLACLFLTAVFGNVGQARGDRPGPGVHAWQASLIELRSRRSRQHDPRDRLPAQNVGALSAVAVGGYIALAGLWSSPISGASMNPARAFGPDLVRGDFADFWVYLAGPLAGGLLAVACARVLRGPGGDPAASPRRGGTLGGDVGAKRSQPAFPPGGTLPFDERSGRFRPSARASGSALAHAWPATGTGAITRVRRYAVTPVTARFDRNRSPLREKTKNGDGR